MKKLRNKELLEYLKNEDESTRFFRVDRLKFLINSYGQSRHLLFLGGPISAYAFEEARLSFLNGLFIGCVLLSQIVIEHFLAGLFRMGGRDDLEGVGFYKLINEALSKKLISQEEYNAFNSLRTRRNPYVHSKDPMDKKDLLRRMIIENKEAEILFEEDARIAMRTLFKLLNRTPFAFQNNNLE